MKKSNLYSLFTAILFSLLFSSCSAVEGIFKAGMGVGIFIVVVIIVIIIAVVARMGKNN